ncbi:CTSC [Cordylochernes scorpioides]|uniref:Dipeptidyl peptidase 1 n=1 Tax=Cordylochernes scorpioides TaxID=51811 RepID=A0ABY6LPS5_9ARAC|nr:CTSC [Cordylochernes scorpioides]
MLNSCVMHRHTGPAPGIMVWGGIGYHSRTPLVRITGTLNSQSYISEVLEPVVLPYLQGLPTAIFQQDNAPPHVARIVQRFFVNRQIELLPWPARSPDLSPIENMCLGCWADTPANCMYEDVAGRWQLMEGPRLGDSAIKCSEQDLEYPVHVTNVSLLYPDMVIDDDGNVGHWTMIYNEVYEATINNRKYLAYLNYRKENGKWISLCGETKIGTSHDVLGHNWACYKAMKLTPVPPKVHSVRQNELDSRPAENDLRTKLNMINRINKAQNSWTATYYPDLDIELRGSVGQSRLPRPAPLTEEIREMAAQLPEEWDWRNVDGVNYVSPVRAQGHCGSCYAYASMGMLEARIRIASKNRQQPILSPQQILDCSSYAQGCDGGWSYLTAGKYAQDYGIVEESCYPYRGYVQDSCKPLNASCPRHYVVDYGYIGGYYGACNEDLIKIQLVKNGPVAVGIMVYQDLLSYSGGIYHHVSNLGYNPYKETNHAVVVVGYGADKSSGEEYWIVKNSWGDYWGENGYIRIRRNTNEINIGTMGMEATPIL